MLDEHGSTVAMTMAGVATRARKVVKCIVVVVGGLGLVQGNLQPLYSPMLVFGISLGNIIIN